MERKLWISEHVLLGEANNTLRRNLNFVSISFLHLLNKRTGLFGRVTQVDRDAHLTDLIFILISNRIKHV